MNLETGLVVGAYKVEKRLGSGGMAAVYRALHQKLNRRVALKVMHAGFQDDPDLIERFNREARIVANLDHPNIVPIYDFDTFQGTPYLVMKLVTGRTLKWHLRKRALSLQEVDTICTSVAEALTYAHQQGVLHRDVKPGNIILAEPYHTPYLTDFGLARIVAHGESSMSMGMIVGTPHYISPEQASGGDDIGPAADVYALGVMLYEMVVGGVPFAAQSTHAIIHDHIYTPPPKPSIVNPEIPLAVEQVLLRVLAKDPAARYPTPADLIDEFHQAVHASGLSELAEDRSEIANRSIVRLREKGRAAGPGTNPVEAEFDLGKMMSGVDQMLRESVPALGGAVGGVVNTVKKQFRTPAPRPYTPPTDAQLESEIRQRVEKRLRARRHWWVHLFIFMAVGTFLLVGSAIGTDITRTAIQGEVTNGTMRQAEADMAIIWATQPWVLVGLFFWVGGLMAHRISVNNLSARREDRRQKRLLQNLEQTYGENWAAIINEDQYAEMKSGVCDRSSQVAAFWGHVWVFLLGNIGLFVLWHMFSNGLQATAAFVRLDDPEAASILMQITAQPRIIVVTLVWLVALVLHGARVASGRAASAASELAQERQLTRQRQPPPKAKHKLEDETPPAVRLTADGELTNSTVERWTQ